MVTNHNKDVILMAIILSAIFLPFSNPVSASSHCDFPAIFNLGDSNSDTGGLSAAFTPTPPPYGETFFHRPTGRYSDGRLIIDFIAKSFGLPYLNPYLNSIGANFRHGADFATAESTIRPQNTSGWSPFSLDIQSVQFSQFISRSKFVYEQGGVFKRLLPKQEYFSKALYTFDIGQNDVTAGLFLHMSTDEVKASIPDILNQFPQLSRSFWIHNTGPFGCLAYVLDIIPVTADRLDAVGCAIPYNEVAQVFNKQLNETVVQLRRDFPLAAFTYVDIYSVKYELFARAKKHGFEEPPLVVCCGYGGKYNFNQDVRCGGTIVVNGSEVFVESCKNPSTRINWDGVHFTEAANKWVFDQIVDGSFSDPPVPLGMACNRHHE